MHKAARDLIVGDKINGHVIGEITTAPGVVYGYVDDHIPYTHAADFIFNHGDPVEVEERTINVEVKITFQVTNPQHADLVQSLDNLAGVMVDQTTDGLYSDGATSLGYGQFVATISNTDHTVLTQEV